MCFYDSIRYICSGEEMVLINPCVSLGNQCIPRVRQNLHSTCVCELCGKAWEVSALLQLGIHDHVTTPIAGIAPTTPVRLDTVPELEPSIFTFPSNTESESESEPQSPLEVKKGFFGTAITVPLGDAETRPLSLSRPKAYTRRRTHGVFFFGKGHRRRHSY